jgi:hypothetical protein
MRKKFVVVVLVRTWCQHYVNVKVSGVCEMLPVALVHGSGRPLCPRVGTDAGLPGYDTKSLKRDFFYCFEKF